jgi:hypothetical protein
MRGQKSTFSPCKPFVKNIHNLVQSFFWGEASPLLCNVIHSTVIKHLVNILKKLYLMVFVCTFGVKHQVSDITICCTSQNYYCGLWRINMQNNWGLYYIFHHASLPYAPFMVVCSASGEPQHVYKGLCTVEDYIEGYFFFDIDSSIIYELMPPPT